MRMQGSSLLFAPQLPAGIDRLAFRILFRGRRLLVEVTPTYATYRLLAGDPLTVRHHGEEISVAVEQPVTKPIPEIETGARPTQPAGRAPLPRGARTWATQGQPREDGYPRQSFPNVPTEENKTG